MAKITTTRYEIQFNYPHATKWYWHETYGYVDQAKTELFRIRSLIGSNDLKYRLVRLTESIEVIG